MKERRKYINSWRRKEISNEGNT